MQQSLQDDNTGHEGRQSAWSLRTTLTILSPLIFNLHNKPIGTPELRVCLVYNEATSLVMGPKGFSVNKEIAVLSENRPTTDALHACQPLLRAPR